VEGDLDRFRFVIWVVGVTSLSHDDPTEMFLRLETAAKRKQRVVPPQSRGPKVWRDLILELGNKYLVMLHAGDRGRQGTRRSDRNAARTDSAERGLEKRDRRALTECMGSACVPLDRKSEQSQSCSRQHGPFK
jgi:hypothetical protein